MDKQVYIGSIVVVHDRGRPQAGRDVHPAIVTQVINGDKGRVAVRVLPEQGVDYPIKAIDYMHGDAYMEGLSWRWPEDEATVSTGAGEATAPEPQDVMAPTPGDHEPRTVAGEAVAKPGDAPKSGEGSDVTGEGSLAAQDGQTDAAEGQSDDPFADLADKPEDGKKPTDGADSASVANTTGNKADTAAGAPANTSNAAKADDVTGSSPGADKAADKADAAKDTKAKK